MLFRTVPHEVCQIAHVDELNRIRRCAWGEHRAAARDPRGPICKAIGRISRTDDVARSDDRRALAIDPLDDLLAQRFQPAVGFSVDMLDRRIGELCGRMIFFDSRRAQVRVCGDARYEYISPVARLQQLRGEPYVARHVARVVDYDVPLALVQRIELAVAIAEPRFEIWKQPRIALASVEQRERVTALAARIHDVRTDEARAAEDQNAHRLDLLREQASARNRREGGGRGRLEYFAPIHTRSR